MVIMVAETVDDVECLRDLFRRAAESSRDHDFGLPAMNPQATMARICKMLGRQDSCVFVLFDGQSNPVGVLAVFANLGVLQEQFFYMADFAHTRQLVNAAKLWGKARGCVAMKLNSSSVDENGWPRILKLLASRGGFQKYSETYVVRL